MLEKSEDGVWSAPATKVPPGVWEYSLVVDGVGMIDPGNPELKPMREPRTSILHLPSTPPAPWDFQDVPHGTVHHHTYFSKVLQRPRELVVYTPPGYETSAAPEKGGERAAYPLLVLQHGSGDNQNTWVAHGKADAILDSLIAAGKARPMIVLMLDGHPLGMGGGKRGDALEAFRRELTEDALPLVEAHYAVKRDPANRGIVGLSMGGGQSIAAGVERPGFAWVGSFSGAVPEGEAVSTALAEGARLNERLRLLWIGVGQDDFLRARNEAFVAKLKEGGINFQWHLTEGGHAWPVWRSYLVEFLPLLFREP